MINKAWDIITSIGLRSKENNKTNAQIRLLNKLALLIASASILALGLNYFIDGVRNNGGAFSCSVAIMIWYFNSRQRHDLSKHLIGFVFPLIVSYLMINHESNFVFTNVFIVHVLLCFILYETNRRLLLGSIISVLVVGLGTLLYIVKYIPSYYLDYNTTNDFILFLSSIVALTLLVSFYQNYIREAVDRKKSILTAIKNKNMELERFAYVTSHDLKEPVRNIENLAKFIKTRVNDQNYLDRNKKMTGLISDSSARMSSLIDSILSYAKLETKKLPVEKVRLNDIIENFKASHMNILSDINASLVYHDLPTITANKTFISLLFQNLIENGFKYNTSNNPLVEISYRQDDAFNVFIVKDNGIGICKEFRTHIFEPFKRLHNNDSYKGSGLGLSICSKIVEMHEGKIWVEENPKGGSVFSFSLPVT